MKKNDTLMTPKWVYEPLGDFDLDPCAGNKTNIARVNMRLEDGKDGLKDPWLGFVWCNPPFSQKEAWIEKMIEHGHGILLLPKRGSAPWFGRLAKEVQYYFVMGKKIDFIGGTSNNNVGSVLFPFGLTAINRIKESGLPGHMVNVKWFNPRSK